MPIIIFLILGVVYCSLFFVVTYLENLVKINWLSFLLDVLLMIIYALLYFCFILGYCDSQIRVYTIVAVCVGFEICNMFLKKLKMLFIAKSKKQKGIV